MSSWSLQTLGIFRLSCDDCQLAVPPTQKGRALLAYLLWNHGTELPRDRIVDLFWPECEPKRGRASLSTALWSIRQSLRAGGIEAEGLLHASKTRLLWRAEVAVDVAEFESRAHDESWNVRRSAIDLYRGEFLDGDYGDWVVATRERTRVLFERLLTEAVDVERDLRSARVLIDLDSLIEAPYDLVVAHEIAHGRRASALAIADRYRSMLAEVGTEPSPAFEAQLANVQATAAIDEPRLPFCGRAQALATIERFLRQAARGGRPPLVLSAEAGAGKSATLGYAMEVARRFKLQAIHVPCLDDDARPFGPWAELYETLTGTAFSESGIAGGATALATALEDASGPRHCFFVDDAHHLRGDALHVLTQLVRRNASTAAFVIATRPEGLRGLLVHIGEVVRLTLAPLRYDDIYKGVRRIAPDDAEAVASFIHQRSGGNPFFANRIFESLIQEGMLQREDRDGSFTLAQSLLNAETPRDLREYIEARLYARGEDVAGVACALALDVRASAGDLVAVCGIGEERTFEAIDSLLALSLIEPADETEFRFSHDLVRETAARALNSGRRARLHFAFAQRLEEDVRRESLVRRALHLRESGEVFLATEAYARAAGAMLGANAWRDAMLCVDAGIALAGELRPSPELHRIYAMLHEVGMRAQEEGGEREAALDHANQRVIHARDSGDSAELARALARRSWSIAELGDPASAVAGSDESVSLSRRLGDDDLIAYALLHRSIVQQFLGDDGALDTARETIAIADRLEVADSRCAMRERFIASACLWMRLDEAAHVAEEAQAFLHRAVPQAQMLFRVRCASLWYLCGDLDRSDAELQAVSAMLRSKHVPAALRSGMIRSLIDFAFTTQAATNARARAQWDEALALAERLMRNPSAEGHSRRGFARLHLIEALLGRRAPGDLERARDEASTLPLDAPEPNLFGMGLTKEAAVARIAVRAGAADARERLAEAITSVTQRALRMPLDIDLSLSALADDAELIGMFDAVAPLRTQAKHLHRQRVERTLALTQRCS